MNRREMLCWLAGFAPAAAAGFSGRPQARMGVASFSFAVRRKMEKARGIQNGIRDPLGCLEHCHALGAGGIQMGLGVRDEAYCERLRQKAEQYGMYIEGSIGVPRRAGQLDRFEAGVRTAKRAGATLLRTAMGGRRYEVFDRLEAFRQWAESTEQAVRRAEPILARHQMQLAIENHKDRRVDELLGLLQRLQSEYVGVCVDTGNDLALLADPVEVARAYAPWAKAVHVKDAAVAEHEDGFLLADVVLGQGIIDLAKIVSLLRAANGRIHFSLEMSTRDPLLVPCLTERYWATLPNVSGRQLARTLRVVRSNAAPKSSLPHVDHLPIEKRVEREQQNIRKSLAYARQALLPGAPS